MKKLICFTLLIGVLVDSRAQDKKASIGFGIGGAVATAKEHNGSRDSGPGVNFYINGLYNINQKFSVGLEYNGNGSLIFGSSSTVFDIKPTVINGILVKGKYHFEGTVARAYVGINCGVYNITPGEVTFSLIFFLLPVPVAIEFEKLTTFGFAPEFGVEIGAFQLSTSFHLPGKYETEFLDGNGDIRIIETKFAVWQFNLGWNIGIITNRDEVPGESP